MVVNLTNIQWKMKLAYIQNYFIPSEYKIQSRRVMCEVRVGVNGYSINITTEAVVIH